MFTQTEENYLKAIFRLSIEQREMPTSTNSIAAHLLLKPATVTAMLKKLKEKKVIDYKRYGKVTLTNEGKQYALSIVRKHRLWEVFLVQKLGFTWDEVHEVAEQLEHIQSAKMIQKLDAYLNYPTTDPHGDPIPSLHGELKKIDQHPLTQILDNITYKILAVNDSSNELLNYCLQVGIQINDTVELIQKDNFYIHLKINHAKLLKLSIQHAQNIFVTSISTT